VVILFVITQVKAAFIELILKVAMLAMIQSRLKSHASPLKATCLSLKTLEDRIYSGYPQSCDEVPTNAQRTTLSERRIVLPLFVYLRESHIETRSTDLSV